MCGRSGDIASAAESVVQDMMSCKCVGTNSSLRVARVDDMVVNHPLGCPVLCLLVMYSDVTALIDDTYTLSAVLS